MRKPVCANMRGSAWAKDAAGVAMLKSNSDPAMASAGRRFTEARPQGERFESQWGTR